MKANEKNPLGFTYNLCYSCIITAGTETITINNDWITVVGLPLDCTSSLVVDPTFVNPPGIPFNSAGSSAAVVLSYTSIFLQTMSVDCPVSSCSLKESGCVINLAFQTNIVFGPLPFFSISGIETNPSGFISTFCYSCLVAPIGQATIAFSKDLITVVGLPLDCSKSLTINLSFVNFHIIQYNSKGSSI